MEMLSGNEGFDEFSIRYGPPATVFLIYDTYRVSSSGVVAVWRRTRLLALQLLRNVIAWWRLIVKEQGIRSHRGEILELSRFAWKVNNLPGVQVWNAAFFLNKKQVKFERMIKIALFNVCSIVCYTFSPSFDQFKNTTSVKIFPFCYEPFIELFFHIFVRTKALLGKCLPINANKR